VLRHVPANITESQRLNAALKWFDEQGNAEPYEGGRDLDALAALCV